ncbi:MAG: PIN domain-containing protein [Nanoarchaeota archaeon]
MKYIIDAYAWVEYLTGGRLGEKVRELILSDNEIISLNITIAEVISKVKRKKGDIKIAYEAINSNSKIIDITPEIAKEAGMLHAEKREEIKNFGLVDAILVITAREIKAKILTGDHHLEDFKEVMFIK